MSTTPDSIIDRLVREHIRRVLVTEGQPLEVSVKTVIRTAFLEAAKVAREFTYPTGQQAEPLSWQEAIAARLEQIAHE